jgi:hypothetical protein
MVRCSHIPVSQQQILTSPPDKAKNIIRSKKTTVQAKNAGEGLIKKPHGRRSRDYNILEEMRSGGRVEISKDKYNNLIVSKVGRFRLLSPVDLRRQCYLHNTIQSSNIDMNLPFSEQDRVEVVKVTAIVRQSSCCVIVSFYNSLALSR